MVRRVRRPARRLFDVDFSLFGGDAFYRLTVLARSRQEARAIARRQLVRRLRVARVALGG